MNHTCETTVAFTGHRTYRHEADVELAALLRELYLRGYRRFLSGMAAGFDLAAAKAVVALRDEFSDVEFVAVIPFEGQDRRFSSDVRTIYTRLLAAADECVVISPKAHRGAYLRRDDFMVDNSSLVVSWYNGSRTGGTCYTIRRALDRGLELWNLHPKARVRVHTAAKLF